MIVVDSSVFVHVLTNSADSGDLIDTLESAKEFAAPHILDLEVLNAFRKLIFKKQMSARQANGANDVYWGFNIHRYDTHALSPLIWSMRNNFTPYDAAYVVLAHQFDLPFLTRDKRLHSAAKAWGKVRLL